MLVTFPSIIRISGLTLSKIAGVGMDCMINTLLFIAGVIPGHIHGFYISFTYFHRKRKVRKGRYPGGRKAGIWSRNVWNGGASNQHVRELWEDQERERMRREDEITLKRSRISARRNRSRKY
jgi:hypothetical protein